MAFHDDTEVVDPIVAYESPANTWVCLDCAEPWTGGGRLRSVHLSKAPDGIRLNVAGIDTCGECGEDAFDAFRRREQAAHEAKPRAWRDRPWPGM
jgi:hypothetical protein